mgnify:CR=1 FL=1|jgi:hypothetical protein
MTQRPVEVVVADLPQHRPRSTTVTHISPTEWQWVILISSALVLAAFAPLIIFALWGTGDVQFMGILHNYLDGGTYLSKMQLGFEGSWVVVFRHTPDIHQGGFIQILYVLLGHLSRITSIPLLVIFHIARLGAALLMYIALYQLGAAIWTKIRARKLFFAIATIGSGFGWFLSAIAGTSEFPDLILAEAFPFYSSLMNVHFPLTLAFLALLLTALITAFRPGAELEPHSEQALPLASALSFGLALLFPQALLPLGIAITLFVIFAAIQTRRLPLRLMRWLLAIGLPALPLFAYYMFLVAYNPAMAEWNRQNITLAPPLPGGLFIFLAGFGLPLLLALPGIWRAVRRFEMDGDRLMLLWLVTMLVTVFLPTNTQRRFGAGMMIPIAYFATRAIEDVWLRYISRRRRVVVFTVVMAIMPISLAFVLFAPVLLFRDNPQQVIGIMLERDYIGAFQWLRSTRTRDQVILATPEVGIWIPGYTGNRVVYAHRFETLDAEVRREQVNAWYEATNLDICTNLNAMYDIRYVIYGPEERKLSPNPVCLRGITPLAQIGDVSIYAP